MWHETYVDKSGKWAARRFFWGAEWANSAEAGGVNGAMHSGALFKSTGSFNGEQVRLSVCGCLLIRLKHISRLSQCLPKQPPRQDTKAALGYTYTLLYFKQYCTGLETANISLDSESSNKVEC